jgi:hypothetical protein
MVKKQQDEGPTTVDINVLNDGTVALVFTHAIKQFVASADEMAQLGMNLIKASQVASMQQPQMVNSPRVPVRRM